MGNKDEIRISNEDLTNLIAAGIKAGVDAAMAAHRKEPQPFVEASADQQFDAMIRGRRGLDRPPIPEEIVRGVVMPSGALADVRSVRGVAVELQNYTHPDGVDRFQTDGGLVPSGYTLGHPQHKQWKYEEFWRLDINSLIGKPLPRHMRPEVSAAAE